MAYTDFVDNKPVATDTGTVFADTTRENLMAMRDAVVIGTMPGWAYAFTAGTPEVHLYSKGTERLRGSVTLGTTGGADGNPTSVVWAYSSDSGSTYDTISTWSGTYNVDGRLTSSSWA